MKTKIDPEKLLAALKELTLEVLNHCAIGHIKLSSAYRNAVALIAESERSVNQ